MTYTIDDMALSPPYGSVLPLAAVEMACCSIHTFGFRVPLMDADRASDWNNIQRWHDHPNCCHYWLAVSPMNLALLNARFLGTINLAGVRVDAPFLCAVRRSYRACLLRASLALFLLIYDNILNCQRLSLLSSFCVRLSYTVIS